METKINYEVAREILTSYMGLLSQEILKEEAKASANMRKKSVLENEQRRAMETLKNLTEDDTDTIEHILYVYGTLLMR